jgi:hypothetical protein
MASPGFLVSLVGHGYMLGGCLCRLCVPYIVFVVRDECCNKLFFYLNAKRAMHSLKKNMVRFKHDSHDA